MHLLCYKPSIDTNLIKKLHYAYLLVFVGNLLGQKGYQAYDHATHKFFTLQDIVFYEHVFQFHTNPQEQDGAYPSFTTHFE